MCIEKREAQLFQDAFFSQKDHLIWDGGSIRDSEIFLVNVNKRFDFNFWECQINWQVKESGLHLKLWI